MSRRTAFSRGASRAVESGVALGKLRNVYARWEREEAEMIEVVEAVGCYLETLK